MQCTISKITHDDDEHVNTNAQIMFPTVLLGVLMPLIPP